MMVMAHADEVGCYPFFRDWRIWAEIQYLDSPTDYREVLRESTQCNRGHSEDLVLLTGVSEGLKRGNRAYSPLILVALLFMTAACLLGWIALENL